MSDTDGQTRAHGGAPVTGRFGDPRPQWPSLSSASASASAAGTTAGRAAPVAAAPAVAAATAGSGLAGAAAPVGAGPAAPAVTVAAAATAASGPAAAFSAGAPSAGAPSAASATAAAVPAAAAPAAAASGAPASGVASSPAAVPPAATRRARRYAAADGTGPVGPVDPAERTAALARAGAALQAGEHQMRTSALARADAALAAAGAPGTAPHADDATEGAGADPGVASGDGTGAGDGRPARGRRRGVLVGAVVAAVLVLGGAGTAWYLTRDGGPADASPADVVLPSPTATAAPVARAATTPFASALPATLLQYALASSADDEDWLGQGAVEAYTETYTDGADASVTVQAGQWETPEEAAAVLTAITGTLPTDADASADSTTAAGASADPAATAGPAVLLQDEVVVGDQPVGTVTVVDLGDGSGVAAWSNGTTVFRVTGPAADIRNLYAAYPL